MRFTNFLVYCPACGIRFELNANNGGYGRDARCCSKECHDKYKLWECQSILGKDIQQ